jgi:hypothetical protein
MLVKLLKYVVNRSNGGLSYFVSLLVKLLSTSASASEPLSLEAALFLWWTLSFFTCGCRCFVCSCIMCRSLVCSKEKQWWQEFVVNNLGWQSSTLPPWFWTTVWQTEKRLHSNNKFQFCDLAYKSQQRKNKSTHLLIIAIFHCIETHISGIGENTSVLPWLTRSRSEAGA